MEEYDWSKLPEKGSLHTLAEIESMELPDSPCLRFSHQGKLGCIQNAHLSSADLLSVPGLASTRWRYLETTPEWIPLFLYVDVPVITNFVDLVDWPSENGWWATPKGFPRNLEERNLEE